MFKSWISKYISIGVPCITEKNSIEFRFAVSYNIVLVFVFLFRVLLYQRLEWNIFHRNTTQ